MKLDEIKKQMLEYRDFYGGDLLGVDKINGCKTKQELSVILREHESHMEMMLNDAMSHLSNFRKKVGML